MKKALHYLGSVQASVLLGCLLISLSILFSGGIIRLKNLGSTTVPTATTTAGAVSTTDKLVALGESIGLDKNKFKACVVSNKFDGEFEKDLAEANAIGPTGTPTFYIGKTTSADKMAGNLIEGAYPYSRFQEVIDALIAGSAIPVDTDTKAAPKVVQVGIDDDPILGKKDAPVTIVEFSDYECPFCKRHFEQTYPQLKQNYIDTGKVRLVYRDLVAVPAHNPNAKIEANAANCARELGGDEAYFKMHDQLYSKTQANGQGLP